MSHFVLKKVDTPATLWIHVRCLNIYKTEVLLSDFTTEVSKLVIVCCTFYGIQSMQHEEHLILNRTSSV